MMRTVVVWRLLARSSALAKRKKKSKIGELCQLSKKNQYGKVEF
jgi:hypothetical protein